MPSTETAAPNTTAAAAAAINSKDGVPEKVIVHPLVLLSVVDHYNRVAANNPKARVVGALLGSMKGKVLDVANSFAVPFEEDRNDSSVWFVDHNYMENMYSMFRKVNAKERFIGWYHTGPGLRQNDLEINELFTKFTPHPLLCTIDVKPRELGLPTDAYVAVEEINDDGTPTMQTFAHVQSEIGAEEAEEIGVEHLLRDIKDTMTGTLSQKVTTQLSAVRGLHQSLEDMLQYLKDVVDEKMPINNQIIYQMQNIFNLLPNLNVPESIQAFTSKSNDEMLVIYLAAQIRTVIALHNLINNKIANREAEKAEEKTERAKENEKDKEVEDKENKTEEKK